jgi:hypothetical protein
LAIHGRSSRRQAAPDISPASAVIVDNEREGHRNDVMPVFTRRRLQSMLDDLSDRIDLPKLNDLRARLESKRVDQALPAETELGVVWALAKLGDVEIEPEWFGTKRPDAYSEFLFAPYPCAVEVTAISDARLSQEDDMRRISAQLCEFANTVRKGHGKHLHFTFAEESGHTPEGYIRRRRIDRDFVPDAGTNRALKDWLEQADRSCPLEVRQGNTHFVVTWHDIQQHPLSNFFSSMPAEAYSLEENPLFEALNEKKRQLSIPNFEGLRCIIAADAGAQMLRDLSPSMRSMGAVTGRQVIEHFLRKANHAVDAVVVLSPSRESHTFNWTREKKRWHASLFVRPDLTLSQSGVTELVSHLPPPRFEGYQARSLQQQALYRHDARGWYLGTCITSTRTAMTIKVSARALLDLLAGRITPAQFQHFTGLEDKPNQRNIFAHRLDQGDILSGIEIEPGGIDEDDDWLVVRFKHDPAAAALDVGTPKQPGDA